MTTYEDLKAVVKKAARSVANQWPGIIDLEDAEQSIWLRLLESDGTVEKLGQMDDRAKFRAVVGIGHQLASAERTDYDHYKGSYTYAVKDVKDLLSRGVLSLPVDGFDAAVLDLMEGLEALIRRDVDREAKGQKPTRYAEAVVSRYADEEVPTLNSAKKRLQHGLEALTVTMNRSARLQFSTRDDGIGTRDVVTNAQTRWESKGSWDADYTPETAEFRDSREEPESIPLLGINP